MATSFEERGRVKGVREMLRKQLGKKFGQLAPNVLQHLNALPPEKIEEIALALMDAKSLDELGLGNVLPEAN